MVAKDFENLPFSPDRIVSYGDRSPGASGDDRSGRAYVFFDPKLCLAVNVALVTGRPLLLRGRSGSGKSSVAKVISRELEWRYYEWASTSKTTAQDLLWDIDYLRRLHDAQAAVFHREPATLPIVNYVNPGLLWWAFNRDLAARRGVADGEPVVPDPCNEHPDKPAVVLIDEIDKAEPDTPNGLLVPLGSHFFRVHELQLDVNLVGPSPLIIVTSNDERTLSPAFLRRCVQFTLKLPDRVTLREIANVHIEGLEPALLDAMLDALSPSGKLVPISPADFVDAARAAKKLDAHPDTPLWEYLVNVAKGKQGGDDLA